MDILAKNNPRPPEAEQSRGILPWVKARGRPADLGFQIGRDRSSQVRRMVETYRRLFREASAELGVADWADGVRIARRYLPFIEESLPQYVDEMRGLSEGAGVACNGLRGRHVRQRPE